MKFVAVIAGVFLTLTIAACAGGRSSGAVDGTTTEPRDEEAPEITVPKRPPPNELVVEVLDEGSGAAIKRRDDEIVVNYVGVEYETGDEFYNSWEQGRPSKFLFEEVHAGWEKGLIGMRVGGRRELIVPPRLAYGTDTLIYIIDLVAVNPSGDTERGDSSRGKPKSAAKRPEPKVPVPTGPAPKSLVVRDLKLGSGTPAKEGDELWVHYAGLNYRTREEFETSWILTFKFELGGGSVNDGWEKGLVGMRVGGRRELIVPPRLAFGSDTLVYLVDLTAVR